MTPLTNKFKYRYWSTPSEYHNILKQAYFVVEHCSLYPYEIELVGTMPPYVCFHLQNVLWLLASIGVFYFTNFALVVLYDERVDGVWLYSGAGCISITIVCCLYCIVWLTWIKRVQSDKWEEHNVLVIPLATIAAIVGGVLICKGLWPVWSVLTIPIVGIQFMGLVVAVAMIPDILQQLYLRTTFRFVTSLVLTMLI